MKFKSILVIILSSIVISCVILLTIFGLSLYIKWNEGESARIHEDNIASLNAKGYVRHISVHDLQARYEKKGIYKEKCLIEGIVKNTGYRTISSLELNVAFLNASEDVIHRERIYPLKERVVPKKTTIAALSLLTSRRESPVMPGDNFRFQHVISSKKDKDIISPIKRKKYATNPNEWSGKFSYSISRVRF